jgi:hypothetical protein
VMTPKANSVIAALRSLADGVTPAFAKRVNEMLGRHTFRRRRGRELSPPLISESR